VADLFAVKELLGHKDVKSGAEEQKTGSSREMSATTQWNTYSTVHGAGQDPESTSCVQRDPSGTTFVSVL
jgi:hypothetical protein